MSGITIHISRDLPPAVAAALAALALAAGWSGCSKPDAVKFEGRTMGTAYHVTLAGKSPPPDARAALESGIEALLEDINRKMSTYDPHSELSRFNRSQSLKPFPVSPETIRVVAAALRVAQESGGAFDPTVGPLVDLWGFGPPERRLEPPGDDAIREAMKVVGYRRLKVQESPPALIKDIPGLRVDLSAIAKGYGVDAVAAFLSERGHGDYLVEIGGEVAARGLNPRGQVWRLGIDRPEAGAAPGAAFSAFVRLKDGGLATSGGYRNFFDKDGRRYTHFIDPRTGRPVTHRLASVSVAAPTCMEADAAATAVMVLGPGRGRGFIEEHAGWEALLIAADETGSFTISATPGFPSD